MIDPENFLLDDGSFVEFVADIMCGCADQFDAPFKSLVVWFCTFEAGQEGVVDINGAAKDLLHEERERICI